MTEEQKAEKLAWQQRVYGLVLLRLDEEISTVSTADTAGFNSLIGSYNSTLGSSEVLIHLSITIIAASSKARGGRTKAESV